MSVILYHNPRCSKSRQTLALLREHGCEPEIIEYLNTPPDAATLRELLDMLQITARELLRTGEAEYKALGLDNPDTDDTTITAAMAAHPRLIQRPIVVNGASARIGRPPESVLEIL